MLEPYDGKLSRTVLRGAWGRKTLGPTRSAEGRNMKIMVLVLSLVLAGGCTKLSSGLKSDSDRAEAVASSSDENKWMTVKFVAKVTDVLEQHWDRLTIVTPFAEGPEEGEVFVLYLDVLAVEPEHFWFRAGSKSDFAIHHLEKWFGTEQEEEIRGQHYEFEMSIAKKLLEGMERRMTQIRARKTITYRI